MKKRFLILLIFLGSYSFWANDINRYYSGWVNDYNFSLPAYLILKENSYSFFFYGVDKQTLFNIPKEEILINYSSEMNYSEDGSFTFSQNAKLPIISFVSFDSFELVNNAGILNYKNALYLYFGNYIFFSSDLTGKGTIISTYADFNSITTSSFLTEKDTVYDGKTFSYYNKNLIPWVENVPGEGIGEWIEVTLDNKLDYYEVNNLDTILISNGYVNFDKPQLYSANNRVKKIQITCPENGMDFEAELEDTAQFQAIKLPEPLPQKKKVTVRFTIKEVYKGTRWNDTCINRILIANSEFLEK